MALDAVIAAGIGGASAILGGVLGTIGASRIERIRHDSEAVRREHERRAEIVEEFVTSAIALTDSMRRLLARTPGDAATIEQERQERFYPARARERESLAKLALLVSDDFIGSVGTAFTGFHEEWGSAWQRARNAEGTSLHEQLAEVAHTAGVEYTKFIFQIFIPRIRVELGISNLPGPGLFDTSALDPGHPAFTEPLESRSPRRAPPQ